MTKITEGQARGLAKLFAAIDTDKGMTAKQFALALELLEITQMGAGRTFGYGGRQIRRYIADEQPIPQPLAKLVKLALAGRASPEYIESL